MGFQGPKLPGSLLDKVQGGRISRSRPQQSRKEKRKAERTAKRATPFSRRPPIERPWQVHEDTNNDEDSEHDVSASTSKSAPAVRPIEIANHAKSIAKPTKKTKSRAEEADDEEIAALEKKLGLNRKKSKKTGDEELDWLVFGSGSEDGEAFSKRKRPEDDDWLRKKRRKATGASGSESEEDKDDTESSDAETGLPTDYDDDDSPAAETSSNASDLQEDDFEGFDESSEHDLVAETAPKRHRENPYVAPAVAQQDTSAAKYVPPSLRKAATTDDEMLSRLRRQLQGLLNRLSEDNLLSILSSIQEVYSSNARQYVTATLIELLRDRICDPSTLNDSFLILHGGFAAALYRTIGTDFGAQLLEALVNAFDTFHRRQELSTDHNQTLAEGKQTLNTIAFLSNLYVLQAISCAIIFDYLRTLLDRDNFSEANTELLLRIIRICGTQLRQDDPTALKDIVMLLQKTISAVAKSNVSVRTKFMIETIHNLKNNRMKTGLAASAMSAEHTQKMKKILGSIKSAKTTEPLRITIADIRNTEKKGKWWLVGASWHDPAKMANGTEGPVSNIRNLPESLTAPEDEDSEMTSDLNVLARAQGMNTDVRRAIFVAVAGAVDYQHAHLRVMKLNLKAKQLLELPHVLLHCVTAEHVYNHFYTLVATKFCGDHRMRKAYQFALLDVYRRMGEKGSGIDDEDEVEDHTLDVKKIFNVAKLYATLVSEGLLRITILKYLDFGDLCSRTKFFVEMLLSTVFVLLRRKTMAKPKARREAEFGRTVQELYNEAHAVPEMIPGLRYFVTSVLPTTNVAANAKEAKVITSGCDHAIESLASNKAKKPLTMDGDSSEGA